MGKADKTSLVKLWIKENVYYQDAKVQPYTLLVTMAINRDFDEDLSMLTRRSAARGLTIFAVPTLSDIEYNRINKLAAALEQATQTTVKDITTNSFEAQAPKSFFQLLKLTKCFANLLFALFGSSCPLFQELQKIIGFLQDYGDTAISAMMRRIMASITWIIHMQSRHFSAGLMTAPKAFLTEILLMMTAVKSKQPVVYGDVPPDMYEDDKDQALPSSTSSSGNSNKRKNGGSNNEQDKKQPKIVKIEKYHPKIKEAMAIFHSCDKLPRVKALCDVANTDSSKLFFQINQICA